MLLRCIASSALALTLVLNAQTAKANVSSIATISNLHISLFDIDLSDGIAPNIIFAPDLSGADTNSVNGLGRTYNGLTGEEIGSLYYIAFGSTVPTALSGHETAADMDISSRVMASTASPGTLELMAQGHAAPLAGTQLTYISAANAPVNLGTQFSLSPNTLLIFSGVADLTALVDPSTLGGWTIGEESGASAKLSVHGVGSSGMAGASSQSDNDTAFASNHLGNGMNSVNTHRQMSVAFTNASNFYINGSLTAQVTATGNSNIMAVPEPGAMLLLIAGLGVMTTPSKARRALRRVVSAGQQPPC